MAFRLPDYYSDSDHYPGVCGGRPGREFLACYRHMDNALGLLDLLYRLPFLIAGSVAILFQELRASEMAWHASKYFGVNIYRSLG